MTRSLVGSAGLVWYAASAEDVLAGCLAAGVRLPARLDALIERRHRVSASAARCADWVVDLSRLAVRTTVAVTRSRPCRADAVEVCALIGDERAAVVAVEPFAVSSVSSASLASSGSGLAGSGRGRGRVVHVPAAVAPDVVLACLPGLRPAAVSRTVVPARRLDAWSAAFAAGAGDRALRSILAELRLPPRTREVLGQSRHAMRGTGAVTVGGAEADGPSFSAWWCETLRGAFLVGPPEPAGYPVGPAGPAELRAALVHLIRRAGRGRASRLEWKWDW